MAKPGSSKRLRQEHRRLSRLAEGGDVARAEAGLRRLLQQPSLPPDLSGLCHNDLGVLLAAQGSQPQAREQFELALSCDPDLAAARANLDQLGTPKEPACAGAGSWSRPPRVAIASLLFNWVSNAAGGGCVHAVGLGQTLALHGCEVKHFFARFPHLHLGEVDRPYFLARQALDLDAESWKVESIGHRFHEAVDAFSPDVVLVTDAWNFKPHLAKALDDWPVWLRFDSQECLCPLNNCRFLLNADGSTSQCPYHQLARPDICLRCLQERGRTSGPFHQLERELSGVTAPGYLDLLREVLEKAQAVLVVNPLIKEMLSPYATRVEVAPAGVDLKRFPAEQTGSERSGPLTIFMAGVVEEPFKGFRVLHEACWQLWQLRQDFRLVATGQRAGRVDEFTEFTGWLSQEQLPAHYQAADICVVPSLVQEGWPIVTLEAMAAGRPVIASRIGGLQFQVRHGGTGLLFEPGDAAGLASCLERLMDDASGCVRLGEAARRWSEGEASWEVLWCRHYVSLLGELTGSG